eukprot:TRINITY_DN2704_c0_g1_i2.p1 TRINITY_DN2704_c0_g1~~TRINITY_DN2704_c0_g1_i2.p1  ORF type:complete len:262 (+),score=38.01 TRINITY_DN2704_c0_g1_i2:75-788(+)
MAGQLRAGATVDAFYRDVSGRPLGFLHGRIVQDNGDGTYTVEFGRGTEGDIQGLPGCDIYPPLVRSPAAPPAPAACGPVPGPERGWGGRCAPDGAAEPPPDRRGNAPRADAMHLPQSELPDLSQPAAETGGVRGAGCSVMSGECWHKVKIRDREHFAVSYRAAIEQLGVWLPELARSRIMEEPFNNGTEMRYVVRTHGKVPAEARRMVEMCWNRMFRLDGPRWRMEQDSETAADGTH